MFDIRTLIIIFITLALTRYGLGRDLPFETGTLDALAIGLGIFAGYVYLLRSLVRLPFALVITYRRARYARLHNGLDRRESLRDGYTRGFLDARRWTVTPLALVDRIALVVITMLASTPVLGLFLVRLGGAIGLALLLVVYLMRGNFSFLVAEHRDERRNVSLPFLNTNRD